MRFKSLDCGPYVRYSYAISWHSARLAGATAFFITLKLLRQGFFPLAVARTPLGDSGRKRRESDKHVAVCRTDKKCESYFQSCGVNCLPDRQFFGSGFHGVHRRTVSRATCQQFPSPLTLASCVGQGRSCWRRYGYAPNEPTPHSNIGRSARPGCDWQQSLLHCQIRLAQYLARIHLLIRQVRQVE